MFLLMKYLFVRQQVIVDNLASNWPIWNLLPFDLRFNFIVRARTRFLLIPCIALRLLCAFLEFFAAQTRGKRPHVRNAHVSIG